AQDKLERALELGATEAVDAREVDGIEPVEYAFSVVGAPQALAQAIRLLEYGGTATLVGIPPADSRLDVDLERDLFHRKAAIRVTHGGDSVPQQDYPELARLA